MSEKNNPKHNKQYYWNKNRKQKSSILLKQSISKPGYHSPKVNSHKSCIPSAVKTDLIENAAPHPSYPLPRIREWPKECVKDKHRPSSGNKSQGCPVPTISECRDIGKSKGSLK